MTRTSPAKINLVLKVLRRRPDGYHDLASLMQQIDLCDEMDFTTAGRGIGLQCPGSGLPEDERNIVYRAARKLLDETGHPGGIEIVLRKRIPVAAGLGGGSSDAATTLATLNEMLHLHVPADRLQAMGASLGADVPFFLFGRSAWAFGIGDRLQPAPEIPPLEFVLVNPGYEVSTRAVYQGLNFTLTNQPNHYSIPRFFTADDLAKGLHNDLETVTLRLHPDLVMWKERLVRNGALSALMSGSGPTVFGIFDRADRAAEAEAALKESGPCTVFRARSLR
ncbi:MAG: 4-diphosphocytidyl-2-C-methyl-D-erythritol kinase [Syntrophaceae bacterium PtaU1.Bin231]|nr:MAG: 4-diphosphocytidyl-2-C-methyl-D-erythritol kinase [Syntrophaceae bacterium PtaU1.Bin231]